MATPDRLETIERGGDSIKLKGDLSGGEDVEVWVHYAIPTPVIIDDERLRAGSALIDWKKTACGIRHVDIYDGKDRIATYEDRHEFDPIEEGLQRFEIPGYPEVKRGIGISLYLRFFAQAGPSQAWFYGAGCDFVPTKKPKRVQLDSKKSKQCSRRITLTLCQSRVEAHLYLHRFRLPISNYSW